MTLEVEVLQMILSVYTSVAVSLVIVQQVTVVLVAQHIALLLFEY